MRARIAEIAEIAMDRVGVKATTTEKLGFTGRREGIARDGQRHGPPAWIDAMTAPPSTKRPSACSKSAAAGHPGRDGGILHRRPGRRCLTEVPGSSDVVDRGS